MSDETLIWPHKPLLKLLEYYALASIGQLPAQREARLRHRVEQTYGGGPEWKRTLRGVLKLDPAGEEVLRRRWQAEQERTSQSGATLDPEAFVRSLLEE